ncbi:MAG: hypothetical protein PHY29_03030 [Syntrophales bacterium]|nr:hypothetical protein [Syntrophales bacterium]
MWTYFKYILSFRQVASVYQEEKAAGKPWHASRRFWGALILALSVIAKGVYGIVVQQADIDVVAGSIPELITSISALYGVALGVVGQIKKQKAVADAPNG